MAKVRIRSWFVYPLPLATLAPAGVFSTNVNIEAATDFYWIKSTYAADIAGAAQTDSTRIVPNVDVQLQSTGADKNLLNAFVPIPSIFGTGQLPYVLPMPQKLLSNSQLRVDFVSREAVNTLNVRLAIHGWKDYGEVESGQ